MADTALTTTRNEFGVVEHRNEAETAMAAVQAREQARINALYIMAERHPRKWEQVRVRLLEHCDRTGFAAQARYKKPTGKMLNPRTNKWEMSYAEGLSARFAEIARQEMGNILSETTIAYEDANLRVVRATVIDTQKNTVETREIAITKITEKRGTKRDGKRGEEPVWEPPAGREILGQRINTNGEPVFICRATEDEVLNRQNALISKTQRDETLRLIPKDIRDDCEARIIATESNPSKVDPDREKKKIIDAFAGIGVYPNDLMNYVGGELERLQPKQVADLRGLYTAIRDGETTWDEALQAEYESRGGSAEETERTKQEKLDRLKREAEDQKRQASSAPPPTEAPKQSADDTPSEEQMRKWDEERLAKERGQQTEPEKPAADKPKFGGGWGKRS